jgi:hypothetical protein
MTKAHGRPHIARRVSIGDYIPQGPVARARGGVCTGCLHLPKRLRISIQGMNREDVKRGDNRRGRATEPRRAYVRAKR